MKHPSASMLAMLLSVGVRDGTNEYTPEDEKYEVVFEVNDTTRLTLPLTSRKDALEMSRRLGEDFDLRVSLVGDMNSVYDEDCHGG